MPLEEPITLPLEEPSTLPLENLSTVWVTFQASFSSPSTLPPKEPNRICRRMEGSAAEKARRP